MDLKRKRNLRPSFVYYRKATYSYRNNWSTNFTWITPRWPYDRSFCVNFPHGFLGHTESSRMVITVFSYIPENVSLQFNEYRNCVTNAWLVIKIIFFFYQFSFRWIKYFSFCLRYNGITQIWTLKRVVFMCTNNAHFSTK